MSSSGSSSLEEVTLEETRKSRSNSNPPGQHRNSVYSDDYVRNVSLFHGAFEQISKSFKRKDVSIEDKFQVMLLFCKECVSSHLHLQSQIDVLKGENSRLRQKVRRMKETTSYLEMKVAAFPREVSSKSVLDNLKIEDQVIKVQLQDSSTNDTLSALGRQIGDIESELKRSSVDCSVLKSELDSLKKIHISEEVSSKLNEKIGDLRTELESEITRLVEQKITSQDESVSIKSEVSSLSEKDVKYELQDASERCSEEGKINSFFTDLHLLHPSRGVPFTWTIPSYEKLKEATSLDSRFLLFSKPFGFEKDGNVRGVLRLVVGLLQETKTVQFGVQVLYAPRYKRRFDFSFRISDQSGREKHLVKVFSSAEVFVPRFWFSQRPSVGSGLISFAFLVPVSKMVSDGLLMRDCIKIDISLAK